MESWHNRMLKAETEPDKIRIAKAEKADNFGRVECS